MHTWITGDEIKASDKWGPGGIVTKWLEVPSFPFIVLTNDAKMVAFTA